MVAVELAASGTHFARAQADWHSLWTQLYGSLKKNAHAAERHSRLRDRTQFSDRRSGSRLLICMLVGYKPQLWPLIEPRFRAAIPPDADICLVSPGKHCPEIASLCARAGWSYLSTSTNDVALAQNICYHLHHHAQLIVKADEDIFLLPDSVNDLLAEYRAVKAEGIVDPGFVAPILPLNGFCYRYLLEMLGLLDEYESRFGRARIATSGLAITANPAAARWIWEHTAPLAATASRLKALPRRHLLCPIQFSIGLIAFERAYWEQMGYLAVHRRRLMIGLSTLGGDEAYLCAKGLELSRPCVVTTGALAGHFSFTPQYAGMTALLAEQPELFAT